MPSSGWGCGGACAGTARGVQGASWRLCGARAGDSDPSRWSWGAAVWPPLHEPSRGRGRDVWSSVVCEEEGAERTEEIINRKEKGMKREESKEKREERREKREERRAKREERREKREESRE